MDKHTGVLGINYHKERKTKRAPKYRLARRSYEISNAIIQYKDKSIPSLLDIGTADGLMFGLLKQELNIPFSVGLDYSLELLQTNEDTTLNLVQGDAVRLPFAQETFDVIIASAVIEHVPDASMMVKECWRVLHNDGLFIITTPVPFFEKIATRLGHIKDEEHRETFNLKKLKLLFAIHNFQIVKAEKFMLSPIGFPFELKAERVLKVFGLSFLLLNQLVVAKKRG